MMNVKDHNDINYFPAWKIAKVVNAKLISATDVSKIFIKRINNLNSKLNAWVSLNHDYVIQQSQLIIIMLLYL